MEQPRDAEALNREVGDLGDAVKSGDYREALVAIRDYLVNELVGHRCVKCSMSQLRTGDTAALVLRLQKVLEELEGLPSSDAPVTDLDKIRRRRRRSDRSAEPA